MNSVGGEGLDNKESTGHADRRSAADPGPTGSGKGAGRMIAHAIATARAADAQGRFWCAATRPTAPVRLVVNACMRHDAQFSLVVDP